MPTEAHLLSGGESGPAVEARLEALLSEVADTKTTTQEDRLLTPLHVAACWGRVPQLRLLLRHGADPTRFVYFLL